MAISLADFPTLKERIEEVSNEASVNAIAEMVGGKFFEEKMVPDYTYHSLILHALPSIRPVADGQQYPKITAVEGDSIAFTQHHYAGIVEVTKMLRKFDRWDEIDNLVKSTMDSTFSDVDQSYADVLLNGFSTSYANVWGETVSATGPDGLALFHTAHTNNLTSRTFRNIITDGTVENPELSRAAVVNARRLARIYRDPQGKNRPIRLNTLVVAPRHEDYAARLINSSGIVGTDNVDINPLKGSVSVEVWEKLETRSDGTDTSNYWFMADSSKVKQSLKAYWSQKIQMETPTPIHDTGSWEFPVDGFYTTGVGFGAYIHGSKGTNQA